MSALPDHKQPTAEEYLAFERDSDEKHEFIDGDIYLMSGGSENHSLIAGNTYASIHNQFRKRDCKAYTSDMRLRTGLNYTYPDVSAICGSAELEDNSHDTLLNPTLIVEVLSPSTERYDRGRKFHHYQKIETLQEYILISQDNYHVERFLRQANDEWLLTDARELDAILDLPSIGCTLALADVYDKVVFDNPESPIDA